jgi:hypothetical protein
MRKHAVSISAGSRARSSSASNVDCHRDQFRLSADGGLEPEHVQLRRTQQQRQVAQFGHRLVGDRGDLGDRRRARLRGFVGQGEGAQLHRRDRLADVVVQFAREHPALVLLNGHQLSRHRVQVIAQAALLLEAVDQFRPALERLARRPRHRCVTCVAVRGGGIVLRQPAHAPQQRVDVAQLRATS